ncbi:MAG: DUF362 domain-containing protein [Armatimonadetes bacterium]|nr:DUF362 domain-containing protein [Armatimonadota bacterium]
MTKTTRREFLKQAAIGGTLIAGLPGLAEAAESIATPRTRVVIAKSTAMLDGDAVNQKEIERVLAQAMAKLTSKSATAAWKSLFKPDDVVGIKINGLFGPSVSTRPEFVNAVIAGLGSAGVKPDNIIVWDRATRDLEKCGFKPNKTGPGVIYFSDDGDWGKDVQNGSFHGQVSKVFDRITALINMPLAKHHGGPGLSCALKNHYGSFHNPGQHHGNGCDPYLADLNAIPQIKDKTRLIVADLLRPQADGGPQRRPEAQWDYHSLMVGTDPVAADLQAYQIIEARRKEVGMQSVAQKVEKTLASAAARGVGTNDPSKIEVIRI